MNRFFRASGAIAAVLVTLVLGGSAQASQKPNGSMSVSPSTVSPGGTVHISGSVSIGECHEATLTDTAVFPPDGFGPTVTLDTNGAFAVDYTVPTSTPAGTYQIGMRCGGGNVGVFTTLHVTAPTGGPATGAGGAAGGRSMPWTLLGLGCLGLAAAVLVVRRSLARRPA
jgi:hypothetical protein